MGKFISCVKSANRTAKEANIGDILEAIKQIDVIDNLPEVFAKNLSQVPDRQPEELNLLRLAQRLSNLENAYKLQSENLSSVVLDLLDIKDNISDNTSSPGNNDDTVASSNDNNDENDDDDEHYDDAIVIDNGDNTITNVITDQTTAAAAT